MDNNTNDYGVMLMVIMPAPRTDSLYHYNAAQNRLEARFTVEYPNKEKIPWHGYSEYPRHFIGDVSVPIQVSENTWSGSKPAKYDPLRNRQVLGNLLHDRFVQSFQ